MNARQTVEPPSKVSLKSCSVLNPSMPEVSAQCMLQKTGNLNGHLLLCTFSNEEFRSCSFLSASHCATTRVAFRHWRVNSASCHAGIWINVSKTEIYSSSRHQLEFDCQVQHLDALNLGAQPLVSTQYDGWVGSTAGMDMVVKRKITALCWGLNPGHSAHSQSLYRAIQALATSFVTSTNYHKKKNYHNMSLLVKKSTRPSAASNENPTYCFCSWHLNTKTEETRTLKPQWLTL